MHFQHKHLPPWGYWSPARFVIPTTTSPNPKACSVVVRHLDNLLRNLHNRLLPQEGKTSNRFQCPTPHQATTQATPCPSPTPPTPPSRNPQIAKTLWRMLLQHLIEVSARITGEMRCHSFRGANLHDLAALIAAFWSQVNHPVAAADHIEVAAFQPHNSKPRPANAAALLKQEKAATSAAGAFVAN